MRLSSLFGCRPLKQQVEISQVDAPAQPEIGRDSSSQPSPEKRPVSTYLEPSRPISTEIDFPGGFWCLPTQAKWINDPWHLRIWEKSRQVGATKTDALDSVLKASPKEARFDVWVTSRDEVQARLYLEDCMDWAKILHRAATYEGLVLLDAKNNCSAHILQFANGRRIYCLSSNPNALAGKRGHVKIDEFALHQDQRLLYRIAKPVTQWGGSLSIISTHRGVGTLFNEIITDIRHKGNPMGWSLHSYPIQKAVEEGIVQCINEKSGRTETNEQFLARTRAECIDDEQWLQEYCCQPADENSALFSYEIISACTEPNLKLMTIAELIQHCRDNPKCSLYAGIDVGRVRDLFVMDVGEQTGDVTWDRVRIELHKATYREMEESIYPILALPQLKRCCFDAKGIGDQLHERAKERFGWKAEGLQITAPFKEELAFALRGAFEDRKLRIVPDDILRADLRALKKEISRAGNIRIDGQIENSHCDRTWAKAYRQYAAKRRLTLTSRLG